MDGKPRPTSGCPSVLRLPDVHKESETPSTSGEGERKFTESSLVYIIPDFPAGANFCRIFLQPREVWRCRQIIGKHNYSFSGKKEAPLTRHFRLQSKNFCLQGLFPSACSMHAFISAASVLKSFSRTASTSSSLCRPNFR